MSRNFFEHPFGFDKNTQVVREVVRARGRIVKVF
jgi:hypothetical protein